MILHATFSVEGIDVSVSVEYDYLHDDFGLIEAKRKVNPGTGDCGPEMEYADVDNLKVEIEE